MTARPRDSVRARRICFETHKFKDLLGRWAMTCHLNGCIIDPTRTKSWRADHIRRWAEGGEDTPENIFPICTHCDVEGKAPKDTSEVAKGKRVYEKQYGIRRSKGSFSNSRFRKKVSGEVVPR
jgi:hypothetical protein